MENKLLSVEGRLELLNEVTKEGLLSLSTTEIRGNDYHVFDKAPANLREYYQLGFMHGDWTHIVYEGERFQFKETMEKSNQLANSLNNIHLLPLFLHNHSSLHLVLIHHKFS